jgi:protein-tyrosine phosphatase
MFGLLKPKHSQQSVFPFVLDMHSHLLPGVDDGSPDVETSLSLIKSLRDCGFRELITTPHIYKELYPNTPDTLSRAYAELPQRLNEQGDITLRFAAEYFLDEYVEELIKSGQPLLTIYDNWVLTEISFVQAPIDLENRLFDLQVAGYKPIMAHPERYGYWHQQKQAYHELKERGVLLQINLLSLTGYYGRQVAETARYLIKEELVDLVGSDCHHHRHANTIQNESRSILKLLDPLLKKDKLMNMHIQKH